MAQCWVVNLSSPAITKTTSMLINLFGTYKTCFTVKSIKFNFAQNLLNPDSKKISLSGP